MYSAIENGVVWSAVLKIDPMRKRTPARTILARVLFEVLFSLDSLGASGSPSAKLDALRFASSTSGSPSAELNPLSIA